MAKTTKKVTTEEVVIPSGETLLTEETTPEEETAELELQAALSEVGDSEVRVQVVKTLPKDDAGACTTYAAQEFSIERLRDDWGGGTYILYFRLPNGQLKTKRRIQVLARKVPPTPPDRTAELIAAMKNNSPGTDTNLILQLMQSQQKSASDMMQAVLGAIAASRPQPQQQLGVAEIVALMTGLQQLSKGGSNESSAVDNLLKGIKLAKELGGDGEGSSVLGSIATVAGPLLEKLGDKLGSTSNGANVAGRVPVPVQARAVQTPAGTDARRPMGARPAENAAGSVEPATEGTGNGSASVPSTEHTPAAPVAEVSAAGIHGEAIEGEDVNLDLMIWLRGILKKLLEKARADKDPALWADVVLDELPAGIGADLVEKHLKDERALDKLAMLDGDVVKYREWFEEFRECILERIEESRATQEAEAERAKGPPSTPADLYADPNPSNDAEDA